MAGKLSLEERVERLERGLEELRRERVGAQGHRAAAAAPDIAPGAIRSDDHGRSGSRDVWRGWRTERGGETLLDLGNLRSGEWWLNKIGIALLLFGLAFLFKFSVDQGWITPAVRVGVGLALGVGLLVVGLRVYDDRRVFSQVLLGGGIGALYITGYACYVLYALVPYTVAFASMVSVTLLAFVLALRQGEAMLSLIGTAGGLATPFVLYTGAGDLAGLVLYACLLLSGALAVYLYRGWRSLLLLSFAGGWSVFSLGYAGAVPAGADRWTLQAGVLVFWLMLWLVPAAREVLRSRAPGRWPLPEPGGLTRAVLGGELSRSNAPAHAVSVAAPLAALAFTSGIWSLEPRSLGWITLGGAAAYALAAPVLRRVENGGQMFYTQALTALLLGTLALVLVLEGNALLFALAAEAAVLHLVASRLSDRIVSIKAHLLSLAVAVWLTEHLVVGYLSGLLGYGDAGSFLSTIRLLVDLAVIALAFGASIVVLPRSTARVYRVGAHAAVVLLLARELSGLSNGATWVFVSWALYAAGLLAFSRRFPDWGTLAGAHLLSAVVGMWLTARLTGGAVLADSAGGAVLDLPGIADLVVIGLAALAPFALPPARTALVYRAAAHLALLAWFWRELSPFPSGDAYVTLAWGLYATGLLVAGLRLGLARMVQAGMATVFLVVAKLFLIDLAGVEAVWRILLFLGFGGLFLILSYYVHSLWRPEAGPSRR